VTAALKLKADVNEVQRCLDEKANVDELQQAVVGMEERTEELEKRLQALISLKASSEDVEAALATKPTLSNLHDSMGGSLSKLGVEIRAEMNEALEKKVSKQSVAIALKAKAGKEEVEALLAQHSDQLNALIATKADVAAMSSALREKAAREEVTAAIEAKAEDVRQRTDRLLGEKPSHLELQTAQAELQSQIAETERTAATTEAAASRARDDLREIIGRVERQVVANQADLQKALHTKAAVSDMQQRPRTVEIEAMLRPLAERAEVETAQHGMSQRFAGELGRVAQDVRTQLDDRLATARQQLIALESQIETKVDRIEMEAALRSKVSTREIEEELRSYAKADDFFSQIKANERESHTALSNKCEMADLQRLSQRLEGQLQSNASNLKVTQ